MDRWNWCGLRRVARGDSHTVIRMNREKSVSVQSISETINIRQIPIRADWRSTVSSRTVSLVSARLLCAIGCYDIRFVYKNKKILRFRVVSYFHEVLKMQMCLLWHEPI